MINVTDGSALARRLSEACRCHAAFVAARNSATFCRSWLDCAARLLAAPSTCPAAPPTVPDACVTTVMLSETCWVPREAS
jgi:hypothetical protein